MTRLTRRLGATVALAAVALVVLAAPAAAHTEAEAEAAPAGRTRVTLSVAVECAGGAATTSLRVQLPEGATDVSAEDQAGWTSVVTDDEVEWSAPSPTVDQNRFTFELVAAQPAGTTVYLPAIQGCPGGEEITWIQVPSSPGEDLEHPAPSFVVPANATTPTSEAAAAPTPTSSTTEPRMAVEQTPVTQEGSETRTAGLIVFVVIIVVIGGGAALLYLRYRRTGNTTPRPPTTGS